MGRCFSVQPGGQQGLRIDQRIQVGLLLKFHVHITLLEHEVQHAHQEGYIGPRSNRQPFGIGLSEFIGPPRIHNRHRQPAPEPLAELGPPTMGNNGPADIFAHDEAIIRVFPIT